MVLFWSARLLILRKFYPLHVYSALHVYCFLRIFPPAPLFQSARLFGTLEYAFKCVIQEFELGMFRPGYVNMYCISIKCCKVKDNSCLFMFNTGFLINKKGL